MAPIRDESEITLDALNHRHAARAHEVSARLHEQLGHHERAAEELARARSEREAFQRALSRDRADAA